MRTAQRRHNDEKILQRRLRTPKQRWILQDDRLTDTDRIRWLGIICSTGTTCSCWCCRTTRKFYGPSIQERRQIAFYENI